MKITKDYDKDNDIMYVNWGKVEHSVELFNGDLILDLDKKDNIVGLEIFGYMDQILDSKKKLDKLLGGKSEL